MHDEAVNPLLITMAFLETSVLPPTHTVVTGDLGLRGWELGTALW